MKHILLIAAAIALSSLSYAQITVNSLNLNVGDEVWQVSDTSFQTDLQDPGENLTWDFSGIHGSWTDTIAPIDPTTTSHASSFTDATLAIGTIDLSAYYIYSTAGIINLGYGGMVAQLGQDAEIVNTDPDTMVTFPLNFGDSLTVNGWGRSSNLTVQGYTGRISNSVQRAQKCDAWGTVITPEGTYEALRVQEETITIDSVFVVIEIFGTEIATPIDSLHQYDTTYVYKFYTNDPTIKLPLLEVEYDPITNEHISTKWIKFPDEVSIKTNSVSTFKTYPNPAKESIEIISNETIENVIIYNLNGKILKSESSKNINISDLPSGLYLIEVKTGNSISKQKLLVE